MGYGASYIIPRFVQYAGKPDGYEPDGKGGQLKQRFPDGSGSSLYYRRDNRGRVTEIDSYGTHFPLGVLQLGKTGKRRRWILNGDWYPAGGFGRTNDHNAMMRQVVQATGEPWIILPFSALSAAGIEPGTIVPAEVLPESWTTEDRTAASLDKIPEDHRHHHVWRDSAGNAILPPLAGDGTEAQPDYAGNSWHASRHTELGGWERVPVSGPVYEGVLESSYPELERSPDGLYHWQERVHHLGESLFRADYLTWEQGRGQVTRRRLFLSAFDAQERPPLYFLAELPAGAHPETVAEAREALKPQEVTKAETVADEVLRQGDIFAIRTELLTRELRRLPRGRPVILPDGSTHSSPPDRRVLGTTHFATEVRELLGSTYARGKLRHRPSGRRPDHADLQLGDGRTWYQLARNTVPHSYDAGRDWPRAWTQRGGVD